MISERWVQASGGFPARHVHSALNIIFITQPNKSPPAKEARVILALDALRNDKELKLEAIAKLMMYHLQPSVADALASLHDATPHPTRAGSPILKRGPLFNISLS
jgi:hypothetical protein